MTEPLNVIAGAPDRQLVIGDIEIPCYVLEDETRVLSQRGMFTALGVRRGGSRGGAQLPRFAASKALAPHIAGETRVALMNPMLFEFEGVKAYGYSATVLVDLCRAVLEARRVGDLHYSQQAMAERCELLLDGLATVGIIALIDEATGYQEVREQRALATILEQFIAEELQPWTKTFPYGFYRQIFRLRGWDGPHGNQRPQVIGHYTNDFVYDRIAPGLLAELREQNPALPDGHRRNRHHQWFTPDVGHPRLREHIAGVIALMRSATDWADFQQRLDIAYPKRYEGDAPGLFDDE